MPKRAGRLLLPVLLGALALSAPSSAAAEVQVGGWLGARFFAENAQLGFVEGAPVDTTLKNGVVLGGRISFPIRGVSQYLVPELELPIVVTTVDGGFGGTVLWTAPRAHLRLDIRPGERLAPFMVIGGGGSFALSSDSDVYASSIQ